MTDQHDPTDLTIDAYDAEVDAYIAGSVRQSKGTRSLLDSFTRAVGAGPVLEIGSGPGWDADYLETRGVVVDRSDATPAFVERLRALGHATRLLDVRHDDLGGPFAGVLANAVLLHLTRVEFANAVARLHDAVVDGGFLAMTVKQGDGSRWSTAKLDRPRYFTYWQSAALESVLTGAGWRVLDLRCEAGRTDDWLIVLAQRN